MQAPRAGDGRSHVTLIKAIQSFFLNNKNNLIIFITVVIGLTVYLIVASQIPVGVDWKNYFRPAALELLKGHSPYTVYGYYNPPWALLPLIPFALLPETTGYILLIVITLIAFAYTGHKLGASKIAVIALLLSPPVMHEILTGNIDWLATIGVVFPPWLGLFFLVIKPQIGIGVIIFWLFSTWKEGGVKNVIKTFAPVTMVYGLSIILFGMWPLLATGTLNEWWDASLWPVSIPLGLALLVTAIRKNDIRYAMGASPTLSPHVIFHSWVVVLLAILSSTPETIAAVVGLWILVAIRIAGG